MYRSYIYTSRSVHAILMLHIPYIYRRSVGTHSDFSEKSPKLPSHPRKLKILSGIIYPTKSQKLVMFEFTSPLVRCLLPTSLSPMHLHVRLPIYFYFPLFLLLFYSMFSSRAVTVKLKHSLRNSN